MRRVFSLSAQTLTTVLLLAGCAVGPDFEQPKAPEVSSYDYVPAEVTADDAQKILSGADISAEWWQLFQSEGLNKLVDQAIKDNPDLATAQASLREAQDNLNAGFSGFIPNIGGTFSAERQQEPGSALGGNIPTTIFKLYSASVNVAYNPDVWGGVRRQYEQLEAQRDAARFQEEAAYLTLTSNVVTLAITEASLREQITATKQIVAAQQKILDIVKVRFDAGSVAKSSVVSQQATLAQAKTGLPPLEHQLVVTRHALSALIGQLPVNPPKSEFRIEDLKLPQDVPLSLPSKLVEHRPDVRVAEENLHAASAAIGVAVAARFPNITLSAGVGSEANNILALFTPGNGFWSLFGSGAVSLFDAGDLYFKERSARDAFDATAEQYRKTVLMAFQNVADTLNALQSDAVSLNVKREAQKAADEALVLTQQQFNAGSIDISQLLIAEQTEEQAKIALVQAEAQRYADTAALFAALGGGWWNRANDISGAVKAAQWPPAFEEQAPEAPANKEPEGSSL